MQLEESKSEGDRILHILGVEYKHSGEVQFSVSHPDNTRSPSQEVRSYTSLTVFPSNKAKISTSLYFDEIDCHIKGSSQEEGFDGDADKPAYITQAPKDCTALIGGTVELDVVFEGNPHPQVKWYKAVSVIIFFSIILPFLTGLFLSNIVTNINIYK